MNRVLQPRPLVVVWMGTAAGADELVEIPTDACVRPGPRRTAPPTAGGLEPERKRELERERERENEKRWERGVY